MNCAPLSTEAVRVVLEREVLRGIVHPQVDLDTGLRGGHARVVHIARPARCRECDRLVRAQTSCRAVAVFIGVSDFAYAGVATEAAQVGVGHSGLSKVERRDARGGLSQAPARGRGACEGAWSGGRDQGPWRAPRGPSLSSDSPPRTLSGSQGDGPASGYGGGPTLRGQGGCGAVAPWPPLHRVPAHRVLAGPSVESAPAPPLVRRTAAARLLATDGSDPAKELSLRPPSTALPATSVSPAATEPAKKPSSASIVGGGPTSQYNQPTQPTGALQLKRGDAGWSSPSPAFDLPKKAKASAGRGKGKTKRRVCFPVQRRDHSSRGWNEAGIHKARAAGCHRAR